MFWRGALACVLGGVTLLACGDPQAARTSAAGSAFRLERFCDMPGMRSSLRHTYILLDQTVLSHAGSPQEFAAINAGVRDAVLAFGDPVGGVQSFAVDYRERVSILLLPEDGSAAKLLFEGCVPALSPEELASSRETGSALSDFFTGGVQQDLHNEAEAFRSRIVSAIVLAARERTGAASPLTGPLPDSGLIASLRASGRLINGLQGIPRIVLLSNLAGIALGDADTREKSRALGFTQGQTVGLDLGRAELHVMLINGPQSSLAREYAEAFFLAQHAQLLTWGGNTPGGLPAAPVELRRFGGDATYPSGKETVQIRVASDRNGSLVGSWLILRGRPDRATPLTGQITCSASDACTLRGDEGGFAQAWSLAPGADPEFDAETPFGGARDWEFTIAGSRLSGRVFDPGVQLGQLGYIPVDAQTADDANF